MTFDNFLRFMNVVFGVLLYIGSLLLKWLAEAPDEIVESMQLFAYTLALGTPIVRAKMAAKKAAHDAEVPR